VLAGVFVLTGVSGVRAQVQPVRLPAITGTVSHASIGRSPFVRISEPVATPTIPHRPTPIESLPVESTADEPSLGQSLSTHPSLAGPTLADPADRDSVLTLFDDTEPLILDPSYVAPRRHVTSTNAWWRWEFLPDGLIYRSYLAGAKEPRMAAQWVHDSQRGWGYETVLGGRVGLVRFGARNGSRIDGWQIDFEGAVFPRLETENLDLQVMDFRYGVPLTYGRGRYQMKMAFYHLSSHLADELMISDPLVPRINYLRDALVWGHSFYATDDLRLYAEAAYSFKVDDGAEPWEFQCGVDYSPAKPTGRCPVPFIAANGHLREEVDFGGNFVLQTGVQWRGESGNLFRLGLHYYNGKSDQFEFFDRHEEKLGAGIWYDF